MRHGAAAGTGHAQPCPWTFDPTIGQPGLSSSTGGSSARAFAELDGDLVMGGSFNNAGGVPAVAVARWDGASWSPMGGGFSSTVSSFDHFQGSLYAFGQFQYAWPVIAWRAARWTGSAWTPLGADHGLQRPADFQYGPAYASIVRGDSLIVGGGFTRAGTEPVGLVAAWDGTDWHPLGAGFDTLASVAGTCQWTTYPPVYALAEYNGDLIAGGTFELTANGDTARCIARWDGTEWHPLGGGAWTADTAWAARTARRRGCSRSRNGTAISSRAAVSKQRRDDGSRVAPGVYFARARFAGRDETVRVVRLF